MPLDLTAAGLSVSLVVFAIAVVLIALAGTGLSAVADPLADRLGLGEAVVGGILVGGVTSLSGIATTVTAAWDGHPELAISHALGGIAVQTVFLVLADLAYRRANLEHAAASMPNLVYLALLLVLLVLPLLAMQVPLAQRWPVHPVTVLLFAVYVFGMRLVYAVHRRPMWLPRRTRQTRVDVPAPGAHRLSALVLWGRFAALAVLVTVAGGALARAAEAIVAQTGLSEALVGAAFAGVATSLPEFVVALAAVRQGALTLAVANIIGGNAFDVLQMALADVAYREGSIYHTIAPAQVFLVVLTLGMSSVLLLGLLYREQQGVANIGFEGVVILLLYAAGIAALPLFG